MSDGDLGSAPIADCENPGLSNLKNGVRTGAEEMCDESLCPGADAVEEPQRGWSRHALIGSESPNGLLPGEREQTKVCSLLLFGAQGSSFYARHQAAAAIDTTTLSKMRRPSVPPSASS
jgi:hypothetical protein